MQKVKKETIEHTKNNPKVQDRGICRREKNETKQTTILSPSQNNSNNNEQTVTTKTNNNENEPKAPRINRSTKKRPQKPSTLPQNLQQQQQLH